VIVPRPPERAELGYISHGTHNNTGYMALNGGTGEQQIYLVVGVTEAAEIFNASYDDELVL
jgi:hypothetical protein